MNKEIQNSEDYLKEITKSNSGFVTPNSYFSEVEEKLYLKAVEDSFSKTEGFGVPDTYFNSLEDVILSKIDATNKKVKVIPLRKKILRWIPAAAAAVIALFVTLNFFDFIDNEITDDEIINWFENDLTAVSNEDFALAFEDSDLNEISITTISENSIQEYLNNQDITSLLEDY